MIAKTSQISTRLEAINALHLLYFVRPCTGHPKEWSPCPLLFRDHWQCIDLTNLAISPTWKWQSCSPPPSVFSVSLELCHCTSASHQHLLGIAMCSFARQECRPAIETNSNQLYLNLQRFAINNYKGFRTNLQNLRELANLPFADFIDILCKCQWSSFVQSFNSFLIISSL